MREPNPYDLIQVPMDADEAEIEEAYNALFDRYEPDANEGDSEAISMLHALNDARDTLMDPRRRAALDSRLSGSEAGGRRGAAMGAGAGARQSRGAVATATARPRQAYGDEPRRGGSPPPPAPTARTARTAKRPRSVAPVARRSPLPFVIAGGVLLAVIVTGVFLLSRGVIVIGGNQKVGATGAPGDVVASVNEVPIYRRDYDERVAKDKENALNDPFFAGLANDFEGITGTRMLDVLAFDALDKLINMEVIQQEAKKEKLYPTTDAQKQGLMEEAKRNDLIGGQSFSQFLQQHNITEEQYNNSVIANTVYAVMAGKHMPQQGAGEERTQAFISWMCERRKSYNVKINLTFNVAGNQPCSSGLPSDVPITDEAPPPEEEGPPVPQPEATGAAPVAPQATPGSP